MTVHPVAVRVAGGILAGYSLDGLLTWASESVLTGQLHGIRFYTADVVTQAFYTCAGGYLACRIGGHPRAAAVGLASAGLVVGLVSLFTSWNQQPHWYSVILWISFAPSALMGVALCDGSSSLMGAGRAPD